MNICSSLDAARYLREKTFQSDVEEFWIIALNPACKVIEERMLFRGTVDACFVHPRDIFRFGLKANATTLIIGHNHPSGDPRPSKADLEMSRKIKEAGELLQIPVVDHVIVTEKKHFSFADRIWGAPKINGSSPLLLL